MSSLLFLLVVSMASAREIPSESKSEASKDKAPHTVENLQTIRKVMLDALKGRSARNSESQQVEGGNSRQQKSYGGFSYFPEALMNYPPPDLGYFFPQGKSPLNQEWRTEPFKRKPAQQQLLDSPIYYVRLPASPYVFVPGIGYVSRPPSIADPSVLNALTDSKPAEVPSGDSNFIHLPTEFVSNAKPTSVYQIPNDPIPIKPKPDSGLYSLDKGPYLFNGKPIELYVLRNSYNQLYADALTNFYP